MDARAAIVSAKKHFSDIFSDEGIVNLGLEEVRYSDERRNWLITLGFSRNKDLGSSITQLTGKYDNAPRLYKIVEIKDSDGKLVAITNRNQNS